MTRSTFGRLAAGLGLCVVGLSGRVAAQSTVADPWSGVPALPTSCFRGDDFETTVNAAADRNNAEWTRQADLNARIKARFDSIDPGERMQRLQAYMMKNPQKAMEAMQAMQATGASVTADVTGSQGVVAQLERELTADTANFRVAVARVRDPIHRAIDDLVKAKGQACGEGECLALPAADIPRYLALQSQLNTDYEKMCGAWWGPTGTFPTWIRRYKEYLLSGVVAPAQKAVEGTLSVMEMMGVPSAGYGSTGPYDAIRDYLDKVGHIYFQRPYRVEVMTPQVAK